MSIIENLSFKFAGLAKKNLNFDSNEAEIIMYGAINLLQTINAILWVIIVGFFTGTLYETFLCSITSSTLRKYSGGVHASSPIRCAIIGATTSGLFGIFVNRIFYKSNINIVIAFCIFSIITSLIIVIRNAPVDCIQKPIDYESKIIFKRKSIILIALITIVIIAIFFINGNPKILITLIVKIILITICRPKDIGSFLTRSTNIDSIIAKITYGFFCILFS